MLKAKLLTADAKKICRITHVCVAVTSSQISRFISGENCFFFCSLRLNCGEILVQEGGENDIIFGWMCVTVCRENKTESINATNFEYFKGNLKF